jgi:DNA-directed RNA polymerase specialized sigma24 family protein
MAKNTAGEDEVAITAPTKSSMLDRIAAFAMLDAMGEATLSQRVIRLSLIGFPPGEIATMLQTTPSTVYQYMYEARKKTTAARKPKAKATTQKPSPHRD